MRSSQNLQLVLVELYPCSTLLCTNLPFPISLQTSILASVTKTAHRNCLTSSHSSLQSTLCNKSLITYTPGAFVSLTELWLILWLREQGSWFPSHLRAKRWAIRMGSTALLHMNVQGLQFLSLYCTSILKHRLYPGDKRRGSTSKFQPSGINKSGWKLSTQHVKPGHGSGTHHFCFSFCRWELHHTDLPNSKEDQEICSREVAMGPERKGYGILVND